MAVAKRTLSKKEQDEIKKKVSMGDFFWRILPNYIIYTNIICKMSLSNMEYVFTLILVSVFRRMSGQQQRFMRNFLLLLKEEGRVKSRLLCVVVLQMQQKVKYQHFCVLQMDCMLC